MRCEYVSANGRLKFSFDGSTVKDVFGKIAMIQENFEPDSKCGRCGGTDLKFRVRHAESRDGKKCQYYELECGDPECRARLSFGQHQEGGTLFAKRKDNDKNWLPDNGWTVYQAGGGGGGGGSGGQHDGGGGGGWDGGGGGQQGNRGQQKMAPPPDQGADIPFSFLIPFFLVMANGLFV